MLAVCSPTGTYQQAIEPRHPLPSTAEAQADNNESTKALAAAGRCQSLFVVELEVGAVYMSLHCKLYWRCDAGSNRWTMSFVDCGPGS